VQLELRRPVPVGRNPLQQPVLVGHDAMNDADLAAG
jgi:hypothetical protein